MEPSDGSEALPSTPPPAMAPENVVPIQVNPSKAKRIPMTRRGTGSKGEKIQLLANHFKVTVTNSCGYFFRYSVVFSYEDGRPLKANDIGRKIIDKIQENYGSHLTEKDFAYDGKKNLFVVVALPRNKMEFTISLDDAGIGSPSEGDEETMRKAYHSKTYKVEICFATKIPMQAIASALCGRESENYKEAIEVLNIILRQHAAKQDYLVFRQSYFHNNPDNFIHMQEVLVLRGFHSSFQATQSGLSLNIDGSTTTVISPGPLISFLKANQKAECFSRIDWAKAKRTLNNLRIKVTHTNQEYRITGLSENLCKNQLFSLKSRAIKEKDSDVEAVEITVYEYFVNYLHINLHFSGNMPCINVGRPKRPIYIPAELCDLLPLQRYKNALTIFQRSELMDYTRQKPQEKMKMLTDVRKSNNYNAEPLLKACGINISNNFMQVEGRVLQAPALRVGNGENVDITNGRWSFYRKRFYEPVKIENWAVVNFSARCDDTNFWHDLATCCKIKGINISHQPIEVFRENQQFRSKPPLFRVEKMFEQILQSVVLHAFFFVYFQMNRRDANCPWKKKNLAEFGFFNQCLIPPYRLKNCKQVLMNLVMKINAKLGGLNSVLSIEHSKGMPFVSKTPTVIFGMDVSHGSPDQSDIPSVAAVVSSRNWPLFSRYRASVRIQSPRVEMIDSLFKPTPANDDDGIIRELLLDFYSTCGQKPAQIIIFRDGVSESQFNQVLNIELHQIIEACKFLDETWTPKFTFIVAQKNHNTRFFQAKSPDNVPPGTVVDTGVCDPKNNDFYMCAHAAATEGTTRPTHYHVLYDELGFSADDLQELVHSLSYVYQRSTNAISIVAPVRYAHLAAAQVSQFLKVESTSERYSSHGGSSGPAPVPKLPAVHEAVRSSMYFC